MEISYLDPKKLKPYAGNAKVHTPEQIEELKRLIKTYGFDQPIVVDADMVIIKGHGRHRAAMEMKLKEVPVNIADHLSKEQARLARLVDNDVVSSDWDLTMLRTDLDQLETLGGSIDMAGISSEYFDDLIDASNQTIGVEISDHLIGTPKTRHVCPKCDYRF